MKHNFNNLSNVSDGNKLVLYDSIYTLRGNKSSYKKIKGRIKSDFGIKLNKQTIKEILNNKFNEFERLLDSKRLGY